MNQAVTAQGWEALLRLRYAQRGDKTRIVERERCGPLAVQRPFYPEQTGVCHTYLLHPPGGVVGGDSLDIQVRVEAGAQALITTPGATKFYRSGGRLATQRQTLSVESGGVLEWLPQENIFFPDACVRVETHVALESGAGFIGWDLQCLGRPVNHEAFDMGEVNSLTRVSIDGELILIDQLRTNGRRLVDAAAGLRGYPMQASLFIVPGRDCVASCQDLLDQIRAVIAATDCSALEVGATLIDGVLVVRALGAGTEPILRLFSAIWCSIRPCVSGLEAVPPRIWAT
ncbi:urease accessory protein UreD [Marinobacterium zhoushanense]|uniref:Urease accessory protein UreD n=1 Tax=Marinobacterium zhoushanense TaxID=1679163 RepID=A0ABQ1K8Q8_9GAMM|nr:urease accessory protein UreD [Marinobacterium zhoushanense]GGB92101.1 urease accessory protein UreD [Marinobacterium zhoushanense]